jgi:hypothetical protein
MEYNQKFATLNLRTGADSRSPTPSAAHSLNLQTGKDQAAVVAKLNLQTGKDQADTVAKLNLQPGKDQADAVA